VWELGPNGVRPLSAGEAGDRCELQPGATLIDAWCDPARR